MSPLDDLKGITEKINAMAASRCISFDPKDLQPDENVPLDRTLVMKVISDVIAKTPSFRESMIAAWSLRSPVSIKDYGQNIFIATFGSREEASRIIRLGPWTFNWDFISISRAMPMASASSYSFDTIEIWVQIHGLPMEFATADNIRILTSSFATLKHFGKEEKSRGGKYVKAKLELPIAKPLPCSIKFSLPSNPDHRLELRYERLGRFCSFCGCIGHDDNSCSLLEDLDCALESPATPATMKTLLFHLREQRVSDDIRAPTPNNYRQPQQSGGYGRPPPPPHPSSGLLGAAPPSSLKFNSDPNFQRHEHSCPDPIFSTSMQKCNHQSQAAVASGSAHVGKERSHEISPLCGERYGSHSPTLNSNLTSSRADIMSNPSSINRDGAERQQTVFFDSDWISNLNSSSFAVVLKELIHVIPAELISLLVHRLAANNSPQRSPSPPSAILTSPPPVVDESAEVTMMEVSPASHDGSNMAISPQFMSVSPRSDSQTRPKRKVITPIRLRDESSSPTAAIRRFGRKRLRQSPGIQQNAQKRPRISELCDVATPSLNAEPRAGPRASS